MIFQQQYSPNTLLQCIRYLLCCFLLHKISVSPSSSYSWTGWLTGDWRNWHHPHDGSSSSSYLSCLGAFLNKKAPVSCKLIQCTEINWCAALIDTQSLPHGYCHRWLCGARPPAHMCWYNAFYLKIFQSDQLIQESAGSNQQALSDAWKIRITEVMLKELSMFCNQF